MATLAVTNVFVDATDAVASEVNENFNDVVTFVNTDVIHRDASIAFTAVPLGPSTDPSTGNQFTRKAYVDASDATEAAARAAHVQPRRGVLLSVTNDSVAANATETIVWSSESGDTDFWSSGNTVTIPAGAAGVYVVTLAIRGVSGSGTIRPRLTSSVASGVSLFGDARQDDGDDWSMVSFTWPMTVGATITSAVKESAAASLTFSARLSVFRVSA